MNLLGSRKAADGRGPLFLTPRFGGLAGPLLSLLFRRRLDGQPRDRRLPVFLAVIAVAAGCAVFAAMRSTQPGASQLSRVPNLNSAPGGQRQRDSAHYRDVLRSANLENADAAGAEGRSYLSIPEALTDPIAVSEVPSSSTPKPIPVSEVPRSSAPQAAGSVATSVADTGILPRSPDPAFQPIPVEIPPNRQPEHQDERAAAMLDQMNAIARSLAAPRPAVADLPGAIAPNEEAISGISPVAAGDLLYGELEIPVSSDVEQPVLARIIAGPLLGTRLIGRFTRSAGAEGLGLSFDRMTLTSGASYSIAAIAIDGRNGDGAVASRIDRRIIERYGPAVLSGFLSGFGETFSRPRENYLVTGNSALVTRNRPSARESVAAGLARATDSIAADLTSHAPAGPEFRIDAGHPLTILFLDSATSTER